MLKNAQIAFDSILANKFRAILTTLGIVFGVGAVISMLAIGNGAQQQILEQLKIVGVNNVIVKSVYEAKKGKSEEEGEPGQAKKFSPGLTLKDFTNIEKVTPEIEHISPEVGYETFAVSSTIRKKSKVIGVSSSYFKIFNIDLENGNYFYESHNDARKKVCLLGSKISKLLFPKSNPIGKTIRVGNLNLTVIGVIKKLIGVTESLQDMGINDYNNEVYVPIKTLLSRFKDRGRAKVSDDWSNDGDPENPNQLDKIVIQLTDKGDMLSTGTLLNKVMERRHNGVKDYSINIPEQTLKQQKETDDLFNWLLGAIASISLVVGGIGIMNIMLASVQERIKEIGLRRAIGAKKSDIKLQFILEASFISLFGGILGIILGISFSYAVEIFLEMPTKISLFSIFLSFIISVLTGIIFGYLPANKAAEQNPVNSLKYE
ncbi:MAG: putative ABC transport system permease protein [Urechidicola sp.]|jgi:putative ABC transport system permease protein|tara:strand:- start:442 stop:1734 length:1293 start_codon:yes stop_codon:yes gene_type:complete